MKCSSNHKSSAVFFSFAMFQLSTALMPKSSRCQAAQQRQIYRAVDIWQRAEQLHS